MKISILTTETIHHAFFIKSLSDYGFNINVYLEKKINQKFPFSTFHDYEDRRDDYEIKRWFKGMPPIFDNYANCKRFESLNSKEAIKSISKETSEISIVFGTGLIRENFINSYKGIILNLHGGDPELYRGLDSHLWAIYHKDFDSLITTLHKLDDKLDNGEIISKGKLSIDKNSSLESLRAENTELCVHLAKNVINMYKDFNIIISSRQRQIGRYYSAMPTELKSICLKNFAKYISTFQK